MPPSPRPGLAEAWARVLAVVVQPGVEFGSTQVVDFVPERARALAAAIEQIPGLVFEAHSTDYQTEAALRALVEAAFRHPQGRPGPHLRPARGPVRAGRHRGRAGCRPTSGRGCARRWTRPCWPTRGIGGATIMAPPSELRFARAFSLSDRCRYYWPVPDGRGGGRAPVRQPDPPPGAAAVAEPASAPPARRHPRRHAGGRAACPGARTRSARSPPPTPAPAAAERTEVALAPGRGLRRCVGPTPDLGTAGRAHAAARAGGAKT